MVTVHEKSLVGTLKTLVIRPSALGDTLLLAPALYQLAHELELTLVGRRPGIDFLAPLIEKCLDYEKGGWHTLFSKKPNCKGLPALDVGRVVSFVTDPDGDASEGLRTCFQNIPVHFFQPFPAQQQKIHVAQYLAQCLNASGLPVNPERAIEEAKRTPLLGAGKQARSGRIIVLHPGSGSEKKNYPVEFWFDLLRDRCLEVFHKKILLLGPAEEKLRERYAKERRDINTAIICCPQKEGLLSLLNGASLYIGHDSGITHLSALLGIPTIALFRDSHRGQWAPLGPHVTVIADGRDYHTILERARETIQQSVRYL